MINELDEQLTAVEIQKGNAYYARAARFSLRDSEAFEAAFPTVPMLKILPDGLDEKGPHFAMLIHGLDDCDPETKRAWIRMLADVAKRAEETFGPDFYELVKSAGEQSEPSP
jgi:hypothetical protein